MVRPIQKKLLCRMSCGLLMIMGSVSHMACGSWQGHLQTVPQNTDEDNRYLEAVRKGDVATVRQLLRNRALNVNAVDRDGNTDLMLTIKGGEQDVFGDNYREIFNLILPRDQEHRNWNLQNGRGQTALSLAVGWYRREVIDALLAIDGVDPNIPNVDNATPLIVAIGNTFVSLDSRIGMARRLIGDLRVNVNQRGTDNKLPLQIIFEANLAPQLANDICRRSLVSYDLEVKKNMRQMIVLIISLFPIRDYGERLSPEQAERIADELLSLTVNNAAQVAANPVAFLGTVRDHIGTVLNRQPAIDVNQAIPFTTEALVNLVTLSLDPRVNVDYGACQLNQIVDAIRRKIHFLCVQLAAKINLGEFPEKLHRIDTNTQLYDNFLKKQDYQSLYQLFTQLR